MEDELQALLEDDLDDSAFAYAVASIMACCEKTGPLTLYGKDWLAAMLSHWRMVDESERIAMIEPLKHSVYLLKRYDSQIICLEDRKGKEYIVSRDSFNSLPDSTLLDNKSFMASLVKYNGEWQVNGMSSWSRGRTLFDAYKAKLSAMGCDSALYDKLMKANENHPMLYFKNNEEMLEWFDRHIGFDENFTFPDQMMERSFLAVYIEKDKDIAIIPNGALMIKDERNPYYDKKEAESGGVNLIVSAEVAPKEMLHYLIEHKLLPDVCINSMKGMERGKQLVQENMDFIARFMRGKAL